MLSTNWRARYVIKSQKPVRVEAFLVGILALSEIIPEVASQMLHVT